MTHTATAQVSGVSRREFPRLGSHIPALDGLRGLAIMLVMVLHFMPSNPQGLVETWMAKIGGIGWVGVDLFFVLSGFLITGILADAKGSPHFFRNFYMRRVLRIFPLYYGVLIFVFGVMPFIKPLWTPGMQKVATYQVWAWIYCSNIYCSYYGTYSFYIIQHFWSLAVEEHFYLVWPLLVFLLSRRAMLRLCVTVMVLGLGVRIGMVFLGINPLAVIEFTPARIDALALGGFLALAARGPLGLGGLVTPARRTFVIAGGLLLALLVWRGILTPSRGTETIAPAATLASAGIPRVLAETRPVYGLLDHDDRVVQTIGFSLLSVFFGALLITALAAPAGSMIRGFFTSGVMRFLGKYAYGLYVFHFPLLFMFHQWDLVSKLALRLHSRPLALICQILIGLSVSVVTALVSYHLYEKHFLKLKDSFEYKPTISSSR